MNGVVGQSNHLRPIYLKVRGTIYTWVPLRADNQCWHLVETTEAQLAVGWAWVGPRCKSTMPATTHGPFYGTRAMSLRCYEWRVWFCGQTTSNPSIHIAPSYCLPNLLGNPEKIYDRWNFNGWKIDVCKMKGLIFHLVVWEHLCGILKVPKAPNGVPYMHHLFHKSFQWRIEFETFILDS